MDVYYGSRKISIRIWREPHLSLRAPTRQVGVGSVTGGAGYKERLRIVSRVAGDAIAQKRNIGPCEDAGACSVDRIVQNRILGFVATLGQIHAGPSTVSGGRTESA